MNILFFSTSSNFFDGTKSRTTTLPSWKDQWQEMSEKHREHNFIIATQLPGMFLVDTFENEISEKAKNIRYEIITSDDETEIANFLAELKPDLAFAATFYVTPYDWLTAKDAIIAEKLRNRGIETICHSVRTGLICFDKWRTHQELERIGIPCAKAVYIHHNLYINGGNRREIKSNVYKTCIHNEINKLNFPVIIKDTVGLSSFGMDVLNSIDEINNYLKSKKFTSDRIIEEMIPGKQFGLEIHGTAESGFTIFSPFMFSVNKYGITSPKQSVKFGPIKDKYFKPKELNEIMKKLATEMNFSGFAQVDLIFNEEEKKWYVIEINPRLSGMSTTYASSYNISLPEMLVNCCLRNKTPNKELLTLNIKTNLLSKEEMLRIKEFNFVKLINQTENLAAKQIRETGYCEIIINGEDKENLLENLDTVNSLCREFMEQAFVETAKAMIKKL